ncbi:hypothetical protein P691DRAFT_788141, partial [Macrolepiota fuliginosa MF-IS2]
NNYSTPQSLLFGNFMFKKRYRAEGAVTSIICGIITGIFMISFAGAAFVVIIYQPLGSQDALGIQEFSDTDGYLLSQDFEDHGLSISATVSNGTYDPKSILGALQVSTYLKDEGISSVSRFSQGVLKSLTETSISCTGAAPPPGAFQIGTDNGINFQCPDIDYSTVLLGVNFEVLITINFTQLSPGPAGSHALTSSNLEVKNAVHIAVSIGEPLETVLQYSPFFSLWPDLHLRGALSFSNMFMVNNIGKEVEQHSVLGGFSVLGGLWTASSGVFTMIFGTSILLVVFGIKPLSIYGLIHTFSWGQVSLADGQALSSAEQHHTVAILREHLMDIGDTKMNGAESPDGIREADGVRDSLIPGRRTDDVEMSFRH